MDQRNEHKAIYNIYKYIYIYWNMPSHSPGALHTSYSDLGILVRSGKWDRDSEWKH